MYSEKRTTRVIVPVMLLRSRTASVNGPRSDSFLVRLDRTPFDDYFRTVERKTLHVSLEAMQNDLDAYLVRYNTARPH